MRLRFNVNQKEALLRGIDATHSFVILDIEPKELDQEEREMVAAAMVDGHDCTKGAIRLNEKGAWYRTSIGDIITLIEPTVSGLREALSSIRVDEVTRIEEAKKEQAKRRGDARKKIRCQLDTPPEEEFQWVHLASSGPAWGYDHVTGIQVLAPKKKDLTSSFAYSVLADSPDRDDIEIMEEARRFDDKIEAERAKRLEASLELLHKKRDDDLRKVQDLKKTNDALIARLPKIAQQKIADGYASEEEISESMRRLLCEDAGYPGACVYLSRSLKELTDEEYRGLRLARERAPEGATVEPQSFGHWRKAEASDSDDDIDDDGEVWEPLFHGFRVEWSVGSYVATADYPFARAAEVGKPR